MKAVTNNPQRATQLLSPGESIAGISFYQQWFAEAWERAGGCIVERAIKLPHFVHVVCGRFWPGFSLTRKRRLIVPASGRIESASWPALLTHEIVPMLWDVWPQNVSPLVRFARRNKVKIIFCTSSQTVAKLQRLLPAVRIEWVPEGIKVDAYPCGDVLSARRVDILSYGRQMEETMQSLRLLAETNNLTVLFRKGREHLFANFEELTEGLRESKISICYPQSMSHPAHAHGLETLTQRYWEAMLSGTLIAGHAPKELIEVCGYNPVIELGGDPSEVISGVLQDIGKYQELANRNRKCAEEKSGWDKRMPRIMEVLG